jgi:hypothetical protein
MNAPHQTLHNPAIPLVELFASRAQTSLHEACGNQCHAFEMYGARNELVQGAAYLRAQARGFEPGQELADWLAAEHEVDGWLFAEIAPIGFVG